MNIQDFEGRVAIVTGAASGLGEATARLFAARGAFVYVADIQDERGRAVADSIGGRATYVHCDVTREEDVSGVIDRAVTEHGRLDVMVNNAGIIGAVGPIDQMPLDEWEFTIAVLLRSVFLGMKHAARVMKPQQSGSIINLSSVAGLAGGLGPHPYTAAKTAVVGLTKNIAAELGVYGIRVNAVSPGKMATPMNAAIVVGDPDDEEGILNYVRSVSPLPERPGTAQDIAEAIVWLSSDAAGFISGQTLAVDGGLTTGSPEGPTLGRKSRFSDHAPIVREAGKRGLEA